LLVTNSNLDQRENAEHAGGDRPAQARRFAGRDPRSRLDGVPTARRPCRRTADDDLAPLECDAAQLITRSTRSACRAAPATSPSTGRRASRGPLRLLIPSGIAGRITWVDIVPDGLGGLDFDCGQLGEGDCDPGHVLEYLDNRPAEDRLPADPARIFIDRGGFVTPICRTCSAARSR
jgi:hypothetical protein